MHDMYLRTIKVRSSSGSINVYVRLVEAYRDHGKVSNAPLRRPRPQGPLRRGSPSSSGSSATGDTGEAEADILDASLGASPRRPPVRPTGAIDRPARRGIGKAKGVPADRAFVLVANRLIRPASEHGLAGWSTDFLCDRRGPPVRDPTGTSAQRSPGPLPSSSRPGTAPSISSWLPRRRSEVALYHHPPQPVEDKLKPRPNMVLYDITQHLLQGRRAASSPSTATAAMGGGRNVQVIVAVVMVAGWPIAHHVWAGDGVGPHHCRQGHRRPAPALRVQPPGLRRRSRLWSPVIISIKITAGNHGYLVGLKRRRNELLIEVVAAVDEAKWIDCQVGVAAERVDGKALGKSPRISPRCQFIFSFPRGVSSSFRVIRCRFVF